MQNQFTDRIEPRQKVGPIDGPVEIVAYKWGGDEVSPDSPEALAKKSYDPATKISRYWLKRATTGTEAGNLFNPQSPMFNAEATKGYQPEKGKGRYEYRKATKESFDLYMKFMTNQNPLDLRGAERA